MLCYGVGERRKKEGQGEACGVGGEDIIGGWLYKVSQFIQGIPARISG